MVMASGRLRLEQSRRLLGQEVYLALRRSIISGELKPNQRLTEVNLATGMGASRTPVREAMRRLESEDLLSKLPTGGYIVRSLTPQDIEEIFGVLSVLESHATYLTTVRLTDKVMQRLEDTAQKYEETLKNNDMEKVNKLDVSYHDTIYKASGSKLLHNLIYQLQEYFYCYRRVLLDLPDMAAIAGREHRAVLEAMRDRDAITAEELARKHILRGRSVLLRAIEEGKIEL